MTETHHWNDYFTKFCKKAKKSAANVSLDRIRRKKQAHVVNETTHNTVLTPESILREYELFSGIGHGGYANIYSAKRKADGTPVALKVIEKATIGTYYEVDNKKVPLEVFLQRRLNHKNIIKLLDYFECASSIILVLERPEYHIDLFDFISKQEYLPEKLARKMFCQVLEAATHCEAKGVFHRDIKDENVVLDLKSGEIKLTDFGSGTVLKDGAYSEYEGTRQYCPPEWYTNQSYQARPATVWSLGILLYDMVCGDVPYLNEDDVINAELSFAMPLSQDGKELISWMLEKDPSKRATIEDILQHTWITET